MLQRQGALASRRLFVLFTATTLAPAIGLGWLGWRMVQQDRALETQRVQERRDHAVDLAAAALARALSEAEETSSQGVATAVFGRDGVLEHTGVALPYYPALPLKPEPSPAVFAQAEALEFQNSGPLDAIDALNKLAKATDPGIRAGALVRLGRVYRKLGDNPRALAAFGDLGALVNTPLNGLPAGLLAQQGVALTLDAAGRKDDLKPAAASLHTDLQSGRWLLTRTSYEFAIEQARRWLGIKDLDAAERESLALAEAAEQVWQEWRANAATGDTRNRRTLWVQNQSVLVLSRHSPDRLAVSLAGLRFLRSIVELERLRFAHQVDFALTDSDGRPVLGQAQAPVSRQSVRTASATRLPWTVHAISTGDAETSSRGRLLLAGIGMMALLIFGAAYLAYRAISREVALARLQTDFVAAVSHEFRTPLTTMRQLSEMLVHDRVSTDARRRQFYDVLLAESDRLRRLVDSLLNFGRIEAGEIAYRFEPLDPAALIREVVADFRQQPSTTGYQIELQESGALPAIPADRESLARVFWNLLDNAVKYSPDSHTVWVDLARVGKRIMVRVRDHGIGIPPGEQKEIFRKFVRGAASKTSAIQGTGVGLAMARQIVEAHRGEISVESKLGEGSVFTVLLPLVE